MDGSQATPIREDVVTLAETLAARLHVLTGERSIQLTFSNGRLRRCDVHHGPIKPEELRLLADELQARAAKTA